ncbi:MAG TPA: AmmeMemoRadiSam system protein A [Polyangiales bacterium]|nr:AmmeMemoRadiSam system protein A [Polyangiales bacterium]
MSIPCAVLMCHAPIVIPEVAGKRAAECSNTTAAMAEAAARVRAHAPDVLVVLSPHGERHRNQWGVCTRSALHGSFARFGAAQAKVSLPGAPEAAQRLLRDNELFVGIEAAQLDDDHGALVPLYFVQRAGFSGATLIISPPARHTHTHERVGQAIARAAASAGERWVVLASGDMSHRLIPGAPCGYDPRAAQFDAGFRACIDRGELREACTANPELRELAAEDVVDSVAVAAAAVDYQSAGHHTLNYEGPFGVGYLEAVLFDATASREKQTEPPWTALLRVAREAIEQSLSGGDLPAYTPLPEPWREPRGVFVTLRKQTGALRGCVGHLSPTGRTLLDEVAACAIAAAERDTRFRPVSARELPSLRIEISLLSPSEPVSDHSQLDPRRYGVIVSCGGARGVLLPDVEGVDTVEDQIRIAADKGGLPANRPWEIERFEVLKHAEELPLTTARRGDA